MINRVGIFLLFSFIVISMGFGYYGVSLNSASLVTVHLYGKVTSDIDEPLSGASVKISAGDPSTSPGNGYPNYCYLTANSDTTTDNDGEYTLGSSILVISGNDKCSIILNVSKEGFISQKDIIVVYLNSNDVFIEKNVVLPYSIKVILRDDLGRVVNVGKIVINGEEYYPDNNGDVYIPMEYTSNQINAKYIDDTGQFYNKSFTILMNQNSQTVVHLTVNRVDVNAPTILILHPDDYSNSSQVEFKFKVIDDYSSIMKCYFEIEDVGFQETINVTNDTVTSILFDFQEDGNYRWSVACEDDAQNEGSAVSTVTVDTHAPNTTATYPTDWQNSDVAVTLSASDNLAGVDKTYYRIDAGSWVEYSNGITISDEGVHTIEFYSVDKAGNKESAHKISVKIDKTAPTTTVNSDYNWGTWTNQDIIFSFTADDALSGVKVTEWRIGNGDWQTYTGGDITFGNEGEYTLQFHSADNAGNIETIQTREIKIDKTNPNITFNPDSMDWTNNAIDVNISAADALSGIKEIGYKVIAAGDSCGTDGYTVVNGDSVTVTISQNGEWKICAYAEDNAGNKVFNESEIYKFDNEAPQLSITAPADGTYFNISNVTIEWSGDDSLSGIAYYNISINGGNWITISGTSYEFKNLADGNYLVKVRAVDNAGNYEEKNVSFIVDTTSPTIDIIAPADGSVHTGHSIAISWTANDQNMDKFEVYVNGKLNATLPTSENSYTLNLEDGTYTVRVVAIDKAGNENYDEVSFIIDNEPPKVEFISPLDWTKENFEIKFNVSDIESKVHCKVELDGSTIFDEDTIGEVSIPVTNALGGDHQLNITCTDNVSLTTTVSRVLKVDNTTPEIISISPSGSLPVGAFLVTVNATDTFSGIEKVIAEFAGHQYVMEKVDGVYQVNLQNSATGTFNVVIKVYDRAGHEASDYTVLNFYKPSTGGGTTGGGYVGGGSCTINGYACETNADCCSGYCNAGICTNMPVNVNLSVIVEPAFQTVFDKDTAKFTFIISNSGKDVARNVEISVDGINGTLSDTVFTLSAGAEKAVYFITKLPAGEYNGTVTVKFENETITKTFSLKVESYEVYQEQQYAKDVCANASMHIVDLAANGMNVTELYTKYDKAVDLMSAGNYSEASAICAEIMNTTAKPNTPTITPFFIAVTNGIKANAAYIGASIGLIAAISVWLKRAAIIRWWQMRKLR